MSIKDIIREFFIQLRIDLTKNLQYDRLTRLILKQVLKENSCCIDVGCHKGEILDLILKSAPAGKHFAFEPIPDYYKQLSEKYKDKATIFPYALSNEDGNTKFQYVRNAPAYSGLRKREYKVQPDIEEINVLVKRLDRVLPENQRIDLIKIDVEGAEYFVLLGAIEILRKYKPFIIFECGLGASEFYNTTPEDVYLLLTECGLKISSLPDYADNKREMTKEDFINCYKNRLEYYFIAYP